MNSIRVFNGHTRYRAQRTRALRLVGGVLKGERCRNSLMNIIFTGDREMVRLNRTYLRRRYPTDVIAFQLTEKKAKRIEGEVYINLDQARRQARDLTLRESDERSRLVIHGVLHLLGYRDTTQRLREAMTNKENHYLLKK